MLSVSKKSRDDGSKLEDVSNPNYNGSPPNEQTVEDEAVESVYYKDIEVDISNTMPPPNPESEIIWILESFKTVLAILLSTLKTCEQVKLHLLWVPHIDFDYGFLY